MIANWRLLRDGDDEAVVLAVDFGPRTGQRGFARFVEHLDIPYPVYETVPPKPAGGAAESARPRRYLEHWAAGLAGRRVRGVLAFCSGARFAADIAGLAGDPPPVILLDPSDVSAAMLKTEFDTGIESLRGQAGADAIRAARRAAAAVARGDDLAAVADALCAEQRRLAEAALLPAGMPGRLIGELCDRFAAYLGYLVAAARTPQRPGPAPSLVVATRDHPLPERYRGQATCLAIPHERLLGDPEAAAMVRQRLTSHPAGLTEGLAGTAGREGGRR